MDHSFEEFSFDEDHGFVLPMAEEQPVLTNHPALSGEGGEDAFSPFGVFGAPAAGPEDSFLSFEPPAEPDFVSFLGTPQPAGEAPEGEGDFFSLFSPPAADEPAAGAFPFQDASPQGNASEPEFIDFSTSPAHAPPPAAGAPEVFDFFAPAQDSNPVYSAEVTSFVEPPASTPEIIDFFSDAPAAPLPSPPAPVAVPAVDPVVPVAAAPEAAAPSPPGEPLPAEREVPPASQAAVAALLDAFSRTDGDSLREEVTQLREMFQEQQRAASAQALQQATSARELMTLKTEHNTLFAAFETGRVETNKLVTALQAENQALRQTLGAVQGVLKTLHERQPPLAQGLASLQTEAKQLRQAVGGLHQEVQALKKGVHVLHSIQRAMRLALEKVETEQEALKSERNAWEAEVSRMKFTLKSTRAAVVQALGNTGGPHVTGVVSRLELASTPGTLTSIHLGSPLRFDRDRHDVVVWRRNGDVERLWALAGEEDLFRWRCPLDPDDSPPLAVGLAQDGLCVGAWWSPEWLQGLPRLLENGAEEAFLLWRWFELPVGEPGSEEQVSALLQANAAAALIAWKPAVAEWPSLGAHMEPTAWLELTAPLLAGLTLDANAVETVLHRLALDETDRAPEQRTDWLSAFEYFDSDLGKAMRGAVGLDGG